SRYVKSAVQSGAAALVVGREVTGLPQALLRVDSAQTALIALLRLFHPQRPVTAGVHAPAGGGAGGRGDAGGPWGGGGGGGGGVAGAVVGAGSRVGALCFVGAGAVLADDVVLHPRAVVHAGVVVGHRVTVHSGAVLGADGFGYAFDGTAHRKIPQVGGLRIADDVEIGANSTIDRATVGDTVIGRGSKIDNLVQVG